MFDTQEMAPPDPILGLTSAFNEDPNPNKINLGVGVYKDASGKTPIPGSVKEAERRILRDETTKSYLPIDGSPAYAKAVQSLIFGADSPKVADAQVATAHTPGGTGALRVAGDLLRKIAPDARLWVSSPTWANHDSIFKAAGFELVSYPYYDAEAKSLDFDAMLEAIGNIPRGDIILLHGCCHNPTGMDPTAEQWVQIAKALADGGVLPLIDLAYLGLADGIDEDGRGVRILADACPEMLVCSSFSKNFGLYSERVGALTFKAPDAKTAAVCLSHMKATARANYSNPPSHGASIVTTVLEDAELRAQWVEEVAKIRDRIKEMRKVFVETLKELGVERDFSFITRQNGMFSFSGLNKDQVERLRAENSIYIVGSGRINVAGMTPGNIAGLCEAIAGVL